MQRSQGTVPVRVRRFVKESRVKITSIKPLIVNANMRNWIFVKVETDEPGLYGWGEATLEWKTRTVAGAIDDLAELLVGEDPLRIEHLYQMAYRQHFWKVGIEGMSAISGNWMRSLMARRQLAASSSTTATRTISQPASARASHWATVASTSRVSVMVMD